MRIQKCSFSKKKTYRLETARKTDKMIQVERQICHYFDQRKDFELYEIEFENEKQEVVIADHMDGTDSEIAAGCFALPSHP